MKVILSKEFEGRQFAIVTMDPRVGAPPVQVVGDVGQGFSAALREEIAAASELEAGRRSPAT